MASLKLRRLAARLRAPGASVAEADRALHDQLTRTLERPAQPFTPLPAAPAPPGAPIGDEPPDWLARPEWGAPSPA